MTQTSKPQQAEPMLLPGEVRTFTDMISGWTVNVYSVAGGSFTHLRIVDKDGRTLFSRSYQFETHALIKFAELRNSAANA